MERIYEQVKENFATTSLATIYKTVLLLKQLNEVLELGFPDGSNRYDGNKPYPHPHMVCIRCKRIIDPDLGSMPKLAKRRPKKPVIKSWTIDLISSVSVLNARRKSKSANFFGINRES